MYSYKTYLAWLFGSLAVSIGIQLALPYPYGLVVSLGLFMVFPFIYRKIMANKYGTNWDGYTTSTKMKKTCTICGNGTKGDQCRRCGSRQFKMS